MSEEYRNIYKIARRTAGFTQEAAAERLGISVESVRAYEIGQRIPPNDIVNAMVSCYGTQHLAVQHLQENNVLFGQVIPQLEERSVLEVTVRIYNRLRRFQKDNRLDLLLAIAEDGIIDDQERPEFETIISDLRQIIQSGLELEVYCKDGN